MTWPLIDAHCHVHDEHLWSLRSSLSYQRFEGVLSRARSVHLSHVVSCATHAHDWQVLEQLMTQQKHDRLLTIVPAFGVRPWWAQELAVSKSDGLQSLREILSRYPRASVGSTCESDETDFVLMLQSNGDTKC